MKGILAQGVDLRLVIPAIVAWLACGVLVMFPAWAAGFAFAFWIAAVALCGLALSWVPAQRLWRAAAASLVVTALFSSLVAMAAPARFPAELVAASSSGEAVCVDVRLDTAPRPQTSASPTAVPRWSFRATTGGAALLVFAAMPDATARSFTFGDRAHLCGTLRRTQPGDASSFLVSAVDETRRIQSAPAWLSWSATPRAALRAASAGLPGDGAALLPGLAIGDVSGLDPALDAALKATSLTHLTAVSGANCALVTGLAFTIGGLVGFGRRARVTVALLCLAAFVILVTPDASVLRASVMAVIVLVGLASGRPGIGLSTLALATIVLLALDPWKSHDFGFSLSVLVTAGLLVLAGPLAAHLARWMPSGIALLVAIPLAAQLACQPVLILLNPTVPLYGVMANLMAEPAVPIATVFGLMACALLPSAPVLGTLAIWVAWLPSTWIAQVARTLEGIPASQLPWLPGLAGVMVAIAVLLLVCLLVLAPRRPGRGWLRLAGALTLLAGAGAYAGIVVGDRFAEVNALPSDWQIAACDVGQGDGVVVRDGDHYAMVDVGRRPGPAQACLERLGIHHLEFVVFTHYDADHIGGMDAVAAKLDRAIVGHAVDAHDQAYLDRLRRGGGTIEQGLAGMHGTLGALAWSVVWPLPAADPDAVPNGNPGSVTIEFEGRGLRSIYLGDLGERAQDALLATGRVGTVDVVKVAHHGSADQSESMYDTLHATVGLISVGAHNSYGHPTKRVLGILANAGTAALRTDRQGMLVVAPARNGGVRVWTERVDEDSVAAHAAKSGGVAWAAIAPEERPQRQPARLRRVRRRFPNRCGTPRRRPGAHALNQ